MSLNGLDDPKVKEAHEAAVAEPGGWFLLKYASRDEVELLGRGGGGIVEIRDAIAGYEEKSPLYGFLRYRRRNVIIKYLPEECSRLIQARVTVHFSSVCDRFSPFDTEFSITSAKELKDTKLSAACSLHAASGSSSSSTSSLRRRRLVEIAEEEEDEERDRKRQSIAKEEERPWLDVQKDKDSPSSAAGLLPSEFPVRLNADLASYPEASHFTDQGEPPSFTGVGTPSSPGRSIDNADRRMSSQSTRADLYSYSSTSYGKPKVKLGPRPSVELPGRPRTSAGSEPHRPVSTIPVGFKISTKGHKKDRSQDLGEDSFESSIKEESEDVFTTPSSPEAERSDSASTRPPTSTGADTVGPSSPSKSIFPAMLLLPTKQNSMTPEKARLLKAMKLREKKKKMSLQPTSGLSAELPAEPDTLGLSELTPEPKTLSGSKESNEALGGNETYLEPHLPISKADSGVEIDAGTDHASVDTRIDSHPASPVAASLEIGASTQASSLSESTDETVLAGKEQDFNGAKDNDSGPAPSLALLAHPVHDDESVEQSTLEAETGAPNAQPDVLSQTELKTEKDDTRKDKNEPNAGHDERVAVDSDVTVQALPISKFSAGSSASIFPPPIDAADQGTTKTGPKSTMSIDIAKASSTEVVGEQGARSPGFRMPVSKFSTQEAKSPTSPTAQTLPAKPTPVSEAHDTIVSEASTLTDKRESGNGDVAETASVERRRSRIAALEPIRTGSDLENSENRQSMVSVSDEDGLMDELQSATLQHAKPITVSKSPITPFFSSELALKRAPGGLENGSSALRGSRTVSSPLRGPLLGSGDASTGTARAASTGSAYLQKVSPPQTSAGLGPKGAKIGSSISQRIKALEKLSGSTGPATGDVSVLKERPATTFFSVRKTPTAREPSRSPSVVERAHSIRAKTPSSPPESIRDSSPETERNPRRGRTGSMVNRLSMFEGGNPPMGRPESIQVTARIVRDPGYPFPKVPEPKQDPADFPHLDLKDSPLLVDHKKGSRRTSPVSVPNPPDREAIIERKQSLIQRRFSKDRRRSPSRDRNTDSTKEDNETTESGRPRRRSSMTVVKDFIKDLGGKSPSTDNLSLMVPPSQASLASPAIISPSRSPSRPPSVQHNTGFPRRLSISSRRSSIEQKSPGVTTGGLSTGIMSPNTTEASGDSEVEGRTGNGSGSSNPASPTHSKGGGSRTTRFMRRLSNTLTPGRKNTTPSISPTVAEEDAAEVEAAASGKSAASAVSPAQQPTTITYLGDVNVQFPDNLLWKRRTMSLDSQGFLLLSMVQGASVTFSSTGNHPTGIIKRYHMSDFRQPYTPEMELQELPNSVVLDFVDGSGLQVACEDRAGQMNVLQILVEAHQSHTKFGL